MDQKELWDTFYSLVGGDTQLRILRPVIVRHLDLIDKPATSSKDLALLMGASPGISSRILGVVNSPAFGLPNKVSDLTIAISLLGYNKIRDILLSLSILGQLRVKLASQMKQLWKHSFYCAKASEIIAESLKRMTKEAFSAGLLHDIGKTVLCYTNPSVYSYTRSQYEQAKGRALHWHSERQLLGVSHAEIGALACYYWSLPQVFYKVVWSHHYPTILPTLTPESYLAHVVHIADILCWRAGFPSVNGPNPYLGKKAEECVNRNIIISLGIKEEQFQDIVTRVDEELEKSERIFNWIEGKTPTLVS